MIRVTQLAEAPSLLPLYSLTYRRLTEVVPHTSSLRRSLLVLLVYVLLLFLFLHANPSLHQTDV